MSACPQCKTGSLVERTNKKTRQTFYGCDGYPACKFAVATLDRLKSSVVSAPEAAPRAASEPLSSTSNDELISALRELTAAVNALAVSFKPEKATGELAK